MNNPITFIPQRSTVTNQIPAPGPGIGNNLGQNTLQNKSTFPVQNQVQPPPMMAMQGFNPMQMGNQGQNPIFKTQEMNQKEREEIVNQLNAVVHDAKDRQVQIKNYYQKNYD